MCLSPGPALGCGAMRAVRGLVTGAADQPSLGAEPSLGARASLGPQPFHPMAMAQAYPLANGPCRQEVGGRGREYMRKPPARLFAAPRPLARRLA